METGSNSNPNPQFQGLSYPAPPQAHHEPLPAGSGPLPQPFDFSTVIYNPVAPPVQATTGKPNYDPPAAKVQRQSQPSGFPTPESRRYASPRQSLPPHATIRAAKASVADGLLELISLQREGLDGGFNAAIVQGGRERFRLCCGTVLDDVKTLRDQVLLIAREAESHRWRRLLLGGIMASLIPAIRAIWRKPSEDQDSATDTEYAFRKSRSLMRRILDLGQGGLRKWAATWTFVVFAAVYVFQNEVKLRVARTMAKKLKHLGVKIGRSDAGRITEQDVKLLDNWRWRVLD